MQLMIVFLNHAFMRGTIIVPSGAHSSDFLKRGSEFLAVNKPR